MRLAAVYFYDNKRLGKTTYNFGGRFTYKIKYENDNLIIERESNDNFIENFYGNKISLLSSIVGENGSGKTTLFKALKDFENDYFLIFEENENLIYVYNTNRYLSDNFFESNNYALLFLQFGDKNNLIIKNFKSKYLGEIDEDFKTAKISFLYYFPNSIFDLELNKIDDFIGGKPKNNLSEIKSLILGKQIRFLSDDKFINEIKNTYKEFPFYDSISIVSSGSFMKEFKYHDIRKFGIENNLNDYEVDDFIKKNNLTITDTFSRLNEIYNTSKSVSLKIFISIYYRMLYIFINIASSSYSRVKVLGDLDTVIENHLKFFKQQNKVDIQIIKDLINCFLKGGIEAKVEGNNDISKVLESINILVELIDIVSDRNNLKEKEFDKLIKFIQAYYQLLDYLDFNISKFNIKTETDISFLRFETNKNLSTGEISLLNFFSSIYYLKQNKYKLNSENEDQLLIFLLDEPELGFHPQWKKRFVYSITQILPLFFPNEKIQIIMSTHDPLTLSDFQNSNIIFLKKMINNSLSVENKSIPGKTFGANINELLAESFFVKDGLIGDFAKRKIQDLIRYLTFDETIKESEKNIKNSMDWDLFSANQLIQIIGEPVVKARLQSLYELKFPQENKESLEQQIKELQRKLSKLQ